MESFRGSMQIELLNRQRWTLTLRSACDTCLTNSISLGETSDTKDQ